MLSVKNLCYSVGTKQLIKDLSFELHPGEFLAILGANGAGKTTLMHCLAGLNKPDSGEVLLGKHNIKSMNRIEIAQQMALVPQQQETAFAFSALEMVVMGKTPYLSTFDSPSAQDIEDARNVMKILDIGGLAKSDYNHLSGGERQLVLLARALLQSQKLLLLDEPTNHLDYRNRFQILSQVKRSCTESNTAVVAILHDPNLAQIYADKVLLLEHGKLLDFGCKQDVMTAENISRLYGLPITAHPIEQQQMFMPQNILTNSNSKIAIVTGESGSGKTTAITELIQHCLDINIKPKGILCPGKIKDGLRSSSEIINIATQERCEFSKRIDKLDSYTSTRFTFTKEGMALGNKALAPEEYTDGDVCIIDEIGPMELGAKGFGTLIAPLLAVDNTRHIWVVRPNLVTQVCRHWSLNKPLVIDCRDEDIQQKLLNFVTQ
ncbi:ATP-binding cassette domain-containing protein [Shewanella intestini]|uniref:ATP-binding cassette domain-containing protein n=1 Tax=Shewanella intestini TaxID=2017544 RepID=A0ABS5HZA6_9GAMM|nr:MULTISPECIES: ATP-binding cassette domain-containing protein [Shewanella]MBR9726903.1 ATP-binding cassette domain-containing protein [Shewanella intestini]MRG34531.1 ATP-binding cassette domain-containing protein [Shewanella sp. XMDDZSB0408]